MDIATRQQFVEYWNRIQPGLGDDDSDIWMFERDNAIRSQWFIAIDPLVWNDPEGFWEWCEEHLSGRMTCYSSDEIKRVEWWGFENKDDVLLWVLKWCDGNAV